MRVAITGAAGFTGRFVAEALMRVGAEPVALHADLTDPDAISEEVFATDFDRIIHLAGVAFAGGIDWRAFYAVNQVGTFNLLAAVANKMPHGRCVLASSALIYGPGAAGLITEDATPNPANHYAVSKRAMELGAELWRDQLELVVARPFNYSGVGQDTRYLLPKIVDHFRRGLATIELGNTWVKRDFSDVRSVADAYAGLVMATDAPPIVNIATGTVSSIGDILDQLTVISGHTIEVKVNSAFVRSSDVPVLGGDVSRLRKTLPGWAPRATADTLAWMYTAAD